MFVSIDSAQDARHDNFIITSQITSSKLISQAVVRSLREPLQVNKAARTNTKRSLRLTKTKFDRLVGYRMTKALRGVWDQHVGREEW